MKYLAVLCIAFGVVGCSNPSGPVAPAEEKNVSAESHDESATTSSSEGGQEKAFAPFVVYQDVGSRNRYTASGYMPTGECLVQDVAWQEECAEGNTCIRVEYDVACSAQGQKWAGVYWLNPADNWGQKKGGYNLDGAEKLVFMAKGEKGGERIEEFKIGGVGITNDYPDSDIAVIGPVILTDEWKEYTIDLRGKDLSNIAGGFAWITNVDVNPESCVFYLDNIRYE